MQERATLNGDAAEKNGDHQHKTHYVRLFRRFILLTVVCSLVPLLLVGWGINIHYTRFAKSRLIDWLQTQLADHRSNLAGGPPPGHYSYRTSDSAG
jgi:hypothetical protein